MAMRNKSAITIVNGAYLHYALTLAESFLAHNNFDFFIYLLDELPSHMPEDHRIKIVSIEDNMIPDLNNRAFYYNITELSTSIKPSLLLHQFDLGYDLTAYLDPDIYVYAPLTDIEDILEDNNIVVTPHSTSPISDGFTPDDTSFLKVGAYNLGFIALKASLESRKFLEWWSTRLKFHAFNAYSSGLFTDQKWIDLAPCYFDGVYILKHQGYNVSYWNINYRKITISNNIYYSNSERLVFYHFSGISLDNNAVSKYSNRYKSYDKLPGEGAGLFRAYLVSLKLNKNLVGNQYNIPYSYNIFSDGREILDVHRLLFFDYIVAGGKCANPFKLSENEFVSLLQSYTTKPSESKFNFDQRIENLSIRISRLTYLVKKPIINIILTKRFTKILLTINNSFNKLNISYVIYKIIAKKHR